MNTNRALTWRKLYGGAASVLPVPVLATAGQAAAALPSPTVDTIEIELPRVTRLRVGRGVKTAMLRLVLDAFERR